MTETSIKLLFSGLAVALTLISFIPYMRAIIRGTTKPHVFSWFIWGITTSIVFFAQLEANGGIGAWPIGISGAITILIGILAFIKRTDISITTLDWVFFLSALASLPFWYLTSDPLWAVVILTTIDLLGFSPTFRKAYAYPHEENMTFFSLLMLRNILVIFALEHFSVTTVLFPLSIAIACSIFLFMVGYRRKVVCV